MKPYGNKRRDSLTCGHGCCGTGKTRKERPGLKVAPGYAKAARKRARAEAKAAARASED
jgi:hypothetical protein